MTDYELLSLYAEYVQIFVTMVTIYTSILFAFLMAAYFAAERLNRVQFVIVTLLFLAVSFDTAEGVRIHGARAASIQTEIVRRIELPGSEIAFVDPHGLPEWLPDGIFVTYLIASLIAVFFAIHVRRSRR